MTLNKNSKGFIEIALIILVLVIMFGAGFFVYTRSQSSEQDNMQAVEQTTTSESESTEQRVFVSDPNDPQITEEQLTPTSPEDVEKVLEGAPIVLINDMVIPEKHTDKILDPTEYNNEERWAYISKVMDAGNLDKLSIETVCELIDESTMCPYIYLQTSQDLANWQLLSVSNTSPPKIGITTYENDLSRLSHGQYYRYILVSKECEQNVCREGLDWTGTYNYKLTATFSK